MLRDTFIVKGYFKQTNVLLSIQDQMESYTLSRDNRRGNPRKIKKWHEEMRKEHSYECSFSKPIENTMHPIDFKSFSIGLKQIFPLKFAQFP